MILGIGVAEPRDEAAWKDDITVALEDLARAHHHGVLASTAGSHHENEMTVVYHHHITRRPSRHTRRTAGMASLMRT